ncbi:MAG: hypothetical protein KDN22_25185 [Verrucomicrobiae bacterium]|nr:hypothetical protein [Verrucomicrobiae bacterium]
MPAQIPKKYFDETVSDNPVLEFRKIQNGFSQKRREGEELKAKIELVNASLDETARAVRSAIQLQLEILLDAEKSNETNPERRSIIPSTPKAFETRNIGTMFGFLPRLVPHGCIDLEVSLEHVRFLGFLNYGTPIQSNSNSKIDNKIPMPIFETSKYSSSTTIESGSWIVVTGLINRSDSRLRSH